jgi:hypothetical protein
MCDCNCKDKELMDRIAKGGDLTKEDLVITNYNDCNNRCGLNPSNICPYCLGSGKLKAMQSAMTYDAGSIRYSDTKVKCSYCNGKGYL